MRTPPSSADGSAATDPLGLLMRLGFGPDTLLMNDPKLFVDGRFLASLRVELDEELGLETAALALFEIGLLHGLRDALRSCGMHAAAADRGLPPLPRTTSLVMQWQHGAGKSDAGTLRFHGCWPERHEAVAHCSRRGAASQPGCFMSAGYTTGWLSGLFEQNLIARETECAAMGATACRFEVRERSEWETQADPALDRLLAAVPFAAFRQVAAVPAPPHELHAPLQPVQPPPAPTARFDRSQSVVHIWGPVMVLPFTTLDEALGTVEMLGRDPGIAEIRAVVIDLREQPLDEGFGAAALEQILETIESWQAQSLITGVSLASEVAVASIESSHLVLRKDLAEAIATAFQIADAQRHRL